jgi:hypothetical protein
MTILCNRWSVSLSSFTDQNFSLNEANKEVTGIPRSTHRSPTKDKADTGEANRRSQSGKTQPMERSDGTSPVKKKTRSTLASAGVSLVEEPLGARSSRGRGAVGSDSLAALAK